MSQIIKAALSKSKKNNGAPILTMYGLHKETMYEDPDKYDIKIIGEVATDQAIMMFRNANVEYESRPWQQSDFKDIVDDKNY